VIGTIARVPGEQSADVCPGTLSRARVDDDRARLRYSGAASDVYGF
jgi:hypothetical protein